MLFELNQGLNVEEDLKEVNKILQAIDLNIPNKKVFVFTSETILILQLFKMKSLIRYALVQPRNSYGSLFH